MSLPFFYQQAHDVPETTLCDGTEKGVGGQKSFYCLANVKFKLLSVVSVVDGSRFKNIFPQYRRNHAVSCETAVW